MKIESRNRGHEFSGSDISEYLSMPTIETGEDRFNVKYDGENYYVESLAINEWDVFSEEELVETWQNGEDTENSLDMMERYESVEDALQDQDSPENYDQDVEFERDRSKIYVKDEEGFISANRSFHARD